MRTCCRPSRTSAPRQLSRRLIGTPSAFNCNVMKHGSVSNLSELSCVDVGVSRGRHGHTSLARGRLLFVHYEPGFRLDSRGKCLTEHWQN